MSEREHRGVHSLLRPTLVVAALLAISLTLAGTGGTAAAYDVDPTLVAVDEAAPESNSAHNSDPNVDLTNMYAWFEGASLDTLVVALDFSSSWDGIHLMILLENKGDAAGASSDPFEFPVDYAHVYKPDLVFTYKYSAADYADLRRWNGRWEFWQLSNKTWTADDTDPGKNALSLVVATGSQVRFRFPLLATGQITAGSTLRLEAYVTQESFDTKYTALDSSPQDSTHDMTPDTGEWWQTASTDTVTLSNYAQTVIPTIGIPPVLTGAAASPSNIYPGENVLLTVHAASAGGGIGWVRADLSAIGGGTAVEMRDDGTGGDVTAADGTYSALYTIPTDVGGGGYNVALTARDASNLAKRSATASLVVVTQAGTFKSASDATGDDHGPAITDGSGNPVAGLYYLYPTNAVFKPGAFDLERADFLIDGAYLVIRLKIGNVLSNSELSWGAPNPGATCTDPNKAQFNLQKIDIYIDSEEGVGATAGFPFRFTDIAGQDAWDYGIAIEGWWKGLVRSNGQNSVSSWTINTQTSVIDFCNDYVDDTVDIKVALSALGNPTRRQMEDWDFLVTMAGHDGDSNAQNLGAIRWVNASAAEWQFGGGSNTVAGRDKDANVIDVMTAPGRWELGGRTQRDMLNYQLPDAVARFDAGGTACVIEATSSYAGRVSGQIVLSDPHDLSTVVTLSVYHEGALLGSVESDPGGGAYHIERLADGTYDLEARAPVYGRVRQEGIVISGGGEVTGIDFSLRKVPGTVTGTVSVDGPPADVTVYLEDAAGEIGGEGPQVIAGGTGSFEIVTVEDGAYDIVAAARGYAKTRQSITVAHDTVDVTIALHTAVATRYAFIDRQGKDIYSRTISRSLPEKDTYDYAELILEPRDDHGNAAIFDSAAMDSVHLRATLLDTSVPARGNVVFADSLEAEIPGSMLTASMFRDGVGMFYVSDDSVEVLRVEAASGARSGAIEVGVGELRPVRVNLAEDRSEVVVGGLEKIEVTVELLDASGNRTPMPDVAIRLAALEGIPIFEPELGITDASGTFRTYVYGYISGNVRFTAAVEPGEFAGLPCDTVAVIFRPGPADRITASIAPVAVAKADTGKIHYKVVDAFGNSVALEHERIDLTASPAALLATLETPVYTDTLGTATAAFKAADRYGLVAIDATSADPVESVRLAVDAMVAANDEAAPESDPAHNSDPNVDLTTLYTWLEADTLKVAVDFSSSWEGVHLMVVLETKGDAAGGDQDPFQFPIYYRQTYRPDFVFTYKYASNDYADLRRWSGAGWEFWQLAASGWTTDGNDPGKNALAMLRKTDTQVVFSFPLNAVGAIAAGSTLRLEAYVTQEVSSKYTALDSSPQDDTQDMIPAQGNWYDTATTPRNLSKYATYTFPPAVAAPALTNAQITPAEVSPGDRITMTLAVTDQGGGVGDVLADLTAIGGDAATRLYDNGAAGDAAAADGIYTARYNIPGEVTQGAQTVWFTARDSLNIAQARASASVTIVNPPAVIISVADSVGDDHGPNLTSSGVPVEGLYYFYPTNGVFAPGSFDIEKVDFMIDGSFLVIRVYLGDVVSSEAVGWNAPYPGETCTNPNKADLNLQKIDVYIDSKEGSGATAGLPYRYVDIARSDAWEFAAVSEGWWKGLIESNGQNSISFWSIKRLANQIDFCDDYLEDYVDVKIALSVLGNPTAEDIQTWDFIITMSGHDGDSNDQNLGATRWVNQATAEWQFGGGRDSEAGRERDANIIDVVTVPGTGKVPGRSQQDMLNYLLDDALKRFDAGKAACIVEATSSVDISPPLIGPFPTDGFAHAVWYVLDYSPASFLTTIEDENDIDLAEFQWRPLGASAWRVVPMVNIFEDYWVADIDPDTLREVVTTVELVDGTQARPFEATVRARDQYGNEAQTSLVTFAVPEVNLPSATVTGVVPGAPAIFYDGTLILAPAQSGAAFDSYDIKITPLSPAVPEGIDFESVRSSMRYLGVARRIEVTGRKGADSSQVDLLASPMTLALHYPTYLGAATGDENKIGIYEYNDLTSRWIGIFGQANAGGNAVSTETKRPGIYALFADDALTYDSGQGLSGVRAEPNPFSPNGDGLYDETRISFFLSREADWVTIEIFDMAAEPVRTIRWQQGLAATGRNAFEIIWDGTDDRGQVVPYGIYVMRLEVRFKVAPYNERQNIGVAVIK